MQQVGVSPPAPRCICRNLVPRSQERDEIRARFRQCPSTQMSEADVEMILLSKAPAIPTEIAREVQLGLLWIRCKRAVVRNDRKLDLLCHDQRGLVDRKRAVQMSSDGTEMAARTNQERCSNLLVDDPVAAFTPQTRKRDAQLQPCTRALQQVVVEFAAANTETDRTPIIGLDLAITPDHASSKTLDRLERPAYPIFIDVEPQI